jgi:glycoside/pentoside/hexuronide:cation symporter, GPH family
VATYTPILHAPGGRFLSEIGYRRARQRQGRLPLSTRIYQAIGALPDTFKNFAFNTFLLFYYNQVLGLPASLASLAIMLALVVDAISDPIVGSLSDHFQSRLGRRHAFMYGAALPLGLALYLVFSPPDGLDDLGLFGWLVTFAVLVRTSMTFFVVPWNALFAEFTDDYVERTAVVTWRYLVGWTGAVIFTFLVWTLIFPSSPEYTPGHLDPGAYQTFALVLGSIVALAALLTTHLTRREIPYLLQPTGASTFSGAGVIREVLLALSNHSFLSVFLAILVGAAIAGVSGALAIYMQTYFWGLKPEELRWFVIAVFGAVAAFALVVPLQRRFDKKRILLTCMALNVLDGPTVVGLRLLDVLPENGEPLLLVILIGSAMLNAGLLTLIGIIGASMIADTLDEQELATGRRQEGVFSAALSFSGKATSGIGVLVGGLILQFGLGFPAGARPEALEPDLVLRLGIAAGIAIPLLNVIPVLIIRRYNLTRSRYAQLRVALEQRRAAADVANAAGEVPSA